MNKSQSIQEISKAMIKVQSEIKGMTPDAKNPFFKSTYITLDGILEYVRPILSKNQIWLVQEAKGLDSNVSVKTSLIHSSGEFLETESLEMVPSKNDPQVLGSLITYLKRYQLAALMGISSEVDDDGNKASGKNSDKTHQNDLQPTQGNGQPNTPTSNKLSDKQINRAIAIGKSKGIELAAIKKTITKDYGKTEIADLTKEQYEELCDRLEKAVSKS